MSGSAVTDHVVHLSKVIFAYPEHDPGRLLMHKWSHLCSFQEEYIGLR